MKKHYFILIFMILLTIISGCTLFNRDAHYGIQLWVVIGQYITPSVNIEIEDDGSRLYFYNVSDSFWEYELQGARAGDFVYISAQNNLERRRGNPQGYVQVQIYIDGTLFKSGLKSEGTSTASGYIPKWTGL